MTFALSPDSLFQSPHLYMQAAGSLGSDSSRGVHTRWTLKGALLAHMPKGKLAKNEVNFNKIEDFVTLYRSDYRPVPHFVDLHNPTQIDPYEWLYVSGGELFYLTFLEQGRYDQIARGLDPKSDPSRFLQLYAGGVLELAHKAKRFFAVQPAFEKTEASNILEIELRSAELPDINAPKLVTLRQVLDLNTLEESKLYSENICSIRFRFPGFLIGFAVEFYEDTIHRYTKGKMWTKLGDFGLSLVKNEVLSRLEPFAGAVQDQWLRFNDKAFANLENYRDKWDSTAIDEQNRLESVVKLYVDLSDDPANPTALERVQVARAGADNTQKSVNLSNLFVLQTAAMDYHIARMLGLGTLDLDPHVMGGHHLYLAEYVTKADLGDGMGPRHVQHLFMSLPTALDDERLPVPIDLKKPVPGIVADADQGNPVPLTDDDGYAFDGRTRYYSLYHKPLHSEVPNAPFFTPPTLFVSADFTLPVFAGLEHRKTGESEWAKPELTFDAQWLNTDQTVSDDHKQETRPIILPDPPNPLYVARERQSGQRDYGSYGINWFSRATSSTIVRTVETMIDPRGLLLPPTNVNALLIRDEEPLLLSSRREQDELATITNADKTFIRLTWDYNHGQELIDYHQGINGEEVADYVELPNADEPFADELEIYFRDQTPEATGGKIAAVADAGNPALAVVTTEAFDYPSAGTDPDTGDPLESLVPQLTGQQVPRFLGGRLSVEGDSFVIREIDLSGPFPRFTVHKNDEDGFPADPDVTVGTSALKVPPAGKPFSAIENMADPANWGPGNPQALRVAIEPAQVHREHVDIAQPDGTVENHIHKFRGVLEPATVTALLEDTDGNVIEPTGAPPAGATHRGLYKIVFESFSLAQHSQSSGLGHRVEFTNGIVRLRRASDPTGPRKELTVIRTQKIGTGVPLVLYAADAQFEPGNPAYDAVATGAATVSYYPGYRAYLFANPQHNLSAQSIQPTGDDDLRYTIFGLLSRERNGPEASHMSVPALMFAQADRPPRKPRVPAGGLHATKPDYFGKSTFTFTTKFEHAPYIVQYLRGNDIQILNALYVDDNGGDQSVWTVDRIQSEIFRDGQDEWYASRWQNLLGLNYVYADNPGNNGNFAQFPVGGVALPLPNNPRFLEAINDFIAGHNAHFGTNLPSVAQITSLNTTVIPQTPANAELKVTDFLREVIQNCFLPLTEVPILYRHIKGPNYHPVPKKQVVRGRNGSLLRPDHPDYDMAPMAKRLGPDQAAIPPRLEHETQFTDFNIDGASNARFFYAVREFSQKMQVGPFSGVLGPVFTVNTAPPPAPRIFTITPVLEQRDEGIEPAVTIDVASYQESQRVVGLELYRATDALSARSPRTMTKVAEIDVTGPDFAGQASWTITDEFSDLGYVPYGDPLFYLVIAKRNVEQTDINGAIEPLSVPSEPSKVVLTNVIETYNPIAPRLAYFSQALDANGDLREVTFVWPKTVHNGRYHLFYRQGGGEWAEVAVVESNDSRVVLPLASVQPALATLTVRSPDGAPIYHHFKAVARNFAGMVSLEDDVLTIHQPDLWKDIVDL